MLGAREARGPRCEATTGPDALLNDTQPLGIQREVTSASSPPPPPSTSLRCRTSRIDPPHLLPRADDPARRGEAFEQLLTVAACSAARGSISTTTPRSVARADQSAEPLLEPQRRVREHVLAKGSPPRAAIASQCAAVTGSVGTRNGSLRDDQRAQRIARARRHPPRTTRCRAARRSARLAEAPEQCVAPVLTVHEERPLGFDPPRTQLRGRCAHVAMAREQHEHAAVRGVRSRQRPRRTTARGARGIHVRRRHVGRDGSSAWVANSRTATGRRRGVRLDIVVDRGRAARAENRTGASAASVALVTIAVSTRRNRSSRRIGARSSGTADTAMLRSLPSDLDPAHASARRRTGRSAARSASPALSSRRVTPRISPSSGAQRFRARLVALHALAHQSQILRRAARSRRAGRSSAASSPARQIGCAVEVIGEPQHVPPLSAPAASSSRSKSDRALFARRARGRRESRLHEIEARGARADRFAQSRRRDERRQQPLPRAFQPRRTSRCSAAPRDRTRRGAPPPRPRGDAPRR